MATTMGSFDRISPSPIQTANREPAVSVEALAVEVAEVEGGEPPWAQEATKTIGEVLPTDV
jgi:hypothetical protein